MTTLSPAEKERQRFARSRAGQIRHGMRTYIETLGVIALAFREQDHLTLGYESWAEYLDAEFSHERLQLDPEMREKAIDELRLGGLSRRAIATTLGVSRNTVAEHFDDLQVAPGEPPVPVLGADGKTYSPARSPLVEAMTGAIEDADERAKNPGVAAPAPAEASSPAGPHGKPAVGGNAGVEVPPASTPAPEPEYPCEGAEYGVCGGEPHTDDCPSSIDHPGTYASAPGETESAGNTSEPGGPVLTARDGTSTAAGAVTPAAPAAPQGQERSEGFRCPACLRPLGAAA